MARIEDLRDRVAQACRVLGTLELTAGTLGHVSARIPGTDRLLIRARGAMDLGVRYVTSDEVIECDLDGNVVSDEGFPAPFEIFIHTAVYKARPDIHSVIHIHPPTIVLFTICEVPLLPLYGAYNPAGLHLVLDGIPTYDRSILIDTPALGDELVAAMGAKRVCLMRGHGITTAANSIEEAALAAIQLNELATVNYHARLLGTPQPISEADQRALRDRGRPSPSATVQPGRPPANSAVLWRHYCALAGELELAQRYRWGSDWGGFGRVKR